ncbi:MAG: hypothetical protein P8107_10685 [Spirochaetia bacterium]
MQLLLIGIGLEVLGLASFVLYDLFHIPFIVGILLHIGGVYLFTRGMEPWLKKVHLLREVCFLLCLFLSLYGMLGVLFQVFVLRKIKLIKTVVKENRNPDNAAAAGPEKAFLFESEALPNLGNFNVKKVRDHSFADGTRIFPYNYYNAGRYKELRADYLIRMTQLELACKKDPEDTTAAAELARIYTEYAVRVETEKTARQKYLWQAKELWQALLKNNDEDIKLLDGLLEVKFLLGEYKECIKLCKRILVLDQVHEHAVVRLAECYYEKRDYKKVTELARNVKTLVKKPEDLAFFTEVWAENG